MLKAPPTAWQLVSPDLCRPHGDWQCCAEIWRLQWVYPQSSEGASCWAMRCSNITHTFWPYLLTPRSRVLLEKLTGFAAIQEIPRIFGTRRFITVLTSARHLSLSWANSIQSSQPPPTSWRSILILSPHLRLGLPSGLFPSGLPTRSLCTPLPCPIRATSMHLYDTNLSWNTVCCLYRTPPDDEQLLVRNISEDKLSETDY